LENISFEKIEEKFIEHIIKDKIQTSEYLDKKQQDEKLEQF